MDGWVNIMYVFNVAYALILNGFYDTINIYYICIIFDLQLNILLT